ncbi:MAG: response regulator [Pirellulaceae bacterium]
MSDKLSQGATVFIVDDDQAVRDSLRVAFETLDLRCREFSSAQEFLDADAAPARGCLIVDMRLPGMNGLELLQTLRSRGITIAVILITGHGDEEMNAQAKRLGALALLQKPFPFGELARSVREALQSQEGGDTP